MNKQYYEKIFSPQRMRKYFSRYLEEEQKAIQHYCLNIELSESFYPVLSIFEVALRNKLSAELTIHFGTEDWFLCLQKTVGLERLRDDIEKAKRQIEVRKENVTGHKITAELTLGFWVELLNVKYEKILWKSLRKAFPYLEKSKKQRHTVSAPINKIRRFRNRIFHHEPIAWDLQKLEDIYQSILLVMFWLDCELLGIVKQVDRIPIVIKCAKEKLL